MKTNLQHHLLAIILLAAAASAAASAPAWGQAAPRWNPRSETIIVSAAAPLKNWRGILTGTNFTEAFAVSASIPVPYSDLDLGREQDAAELDRRINVAAQVVCTQLDVKYPRSQYPVLGDDNCEQVARKDGLSSANLIIAAVRK